MPKKNGRKIMIPAMLERDEIKYLERKVDKAKEGYQSRNALIRTLVRKSMQDNLL